jgi:hypothetical protein
MLIFDDEKMMECRFLAEILAQPWSAQTATASAAHFISR